MSLSTASWRWTMAMLRVRRRAVWSKGVRGPEHPEAGAGNRLAIGPGPNRLLPNRHKGWLNSVGPRYNALEPPFVTVRNGSNPDDRRNLST